MSKLQLLLFLVFSIKTIWCYPEITIRPHPHYKKLTFENFLKEHGVALSRHQILTEDGYFLTLFRIYDEILGPHQNKTPILLVHGMTSDCSAYFLVKFELSLPHLLLANENDVWCINTRGTKPSKKHKNFSPNTKAFWNFSWHESGVYDLPPAIDYIINNTKHQKVIGVGHSSGSTNFFVLLSKKPEYNRKIERVFTMGPSIGSKYTKEPLLIFLTQFLPHFQWVEEIFYNIPGPHELMWKICEINYLMSVFCTHALSIYFGYNPEQCNYGATSTLLSVSPNMISTKQLFHYGITSYRGRFCEYNYGREINLKVYGTPYPRDYNWTNIVAPFTLLSAEGDWLTPPAEVRLVHRFLSNSTVYKVPCRHFNHLDFITGKYAWRCVYTKIIDTIN